MFRDIAELIRNHKPISSWCYHCHTTTSQVYKEVPKPTYKDTETYYCNACHTIRYYDIYPKKNVD